MPKEEVATQETETQETTAQEEVTEEKEETPDAEEVLKPLEADEEEEFDESFEEEEPPSDEAEEQEPDEDKRTKEYWKKKADFYEKKARKVDSIEAVNKALDKYSVKNPVAKNHLDTLAKKGRPQNEIFRDAKFASKLINAERADIKAQLESKYGKLENLKAQAKADAEAEVSDLWGSPDPGNKANETLVDWDKIKDLPASEQLKYADRLKPSDTGWIGNRPKK